MHYDLFLVPVQIKIRSVNAAFQKVNDSRTVSIGFTYKFDRRYIDADEITGIKSSSTKRTGSCHISGSY